MKHTKANRLESAEYLLQIVYVQLLEIVMGPSQNFHGSSISSPKFSSRVEFRAKIFRAVFESSHLRAKNFRANFESSHFRAANFSSNFEPSHFRAANFSSIFEPSRFRAANFRASSSYARASNGSYPSLTHNINLFKFGKSQNSTCWVCKVFHMNFAQSNLNLMYILSTMYFSTRAY